MRISDDEKTLYSLENTNMPKNFIKAYGYFLDAKTGDNGSYSQAALEFREAFEKSGKDTHTQLNCRVLEALCHFLTLDIDKALPEAKGALSIAIKEYPDVPLIKALNESDKKVEAGTEYKRISELAQLLSSIPITEKDTFTLCEKLAEKRKIHLHNPDLQKNWKHAALILAVLLNKDAPSFQFIEEKVRQAACSSNLRQLGVMLFLYAQEHDGKLPLPYSAAEKTIWMSEILKQQQVSWTKRGATFRCPSLMKKGKDGYSYGMNIIFMTEDSKKLIKKDKILLLSDSIHYMPGNYSHKPEYSGAAFQIQSSYEHSGIGTVDRQRHMGGANVLFSDGSVEWLSSKQISDNPEQPLWKN